MNKNVLCCFNEHCKYIQLNYDYTVNIETFIDNYITQNSKKFNIENCDEYFDIWCYIAGYEDLKYEFWNYDINTLDENKVIINYIMHGFNNGFKRNLYNICRSEAILKLKNNISIAIVGNAQISEEEQDEINTYDIVVRTNNCNSYRENDKIDILFYRGVRLRAATDFPFHILKENLGIKTYHINGQECDEKHYYNNLNKKCYYYKSVTNILPNYQKSNNKQIPSCGFLCIKKIMEYFQNEKYDVYGFTFQVMDKSFHNLNYEKTEILNNNKIVYHQPKIVSKKIHHI